jgi:predicted lipoprotein
MAADQAMQTLTEAGAAPATAGQELAALPPIATQLPPASSMEKAVAALDVVKRLMQDSIAPLLGVTLGFSDSDGD